MLNFMPIFFVLNLAKFHNSPNNGGLGKSGGGTVAKSWV